MLLQFNHEFKYALFAYRSSIVFIHMKAPLNSLESKLSKQFGQ